MPTLLELLGALGAVHLLALFGLILAVLRSR